MVTPNRVVALLTPAFAALAGYVATWVAEHFPGTDIDQGALEEIFIAGALIGLAPAAQWLRGWQKYEEREAEQEHAVELANAGAGGTAGTAADEAEEDDYDYEVDDAYESDAEDLDDLEDELFADEQLAEGRS